MNLIKGVKVEMPEKIFNKLSVKAVKNEITIQRLLGLLLEYVSNNWKDFNFEAIIKEERKTK